MRLIAAITVLTALAPATPVAGRLFWQTYGATVATDSGCAWNINQDYFVPRHCDSCRYDLLSPCKEYRTKSPACKYLHPLYAGYCTPYAPCHYRRRDHVYKARCGCTPLKYSYGPWRLDRCDKHSGQRDKHPLVLRAEASQCASCPGGGWLALGAAEGAATYYGGDFEALPHVEPMGGTILGSVAALPGRLGAGGATSGMASSGAGAGLSPAAGQSILPAFGITPSTGTPGGGALPPVSSF
ncbi:MAG: hypothetical protein IT424_10385 [Pirellulales bacterium]|nr:hypothetical protein [Pirellulales bacterium]